METLGKSAGNRVKIVGNGKWKEYGENMKKLLENCCFHESNHGKR
jgi:hypothetical protein